MAAQIAIFAGLLPLFGTACGCDLARLERSLWLNVSLAAPRLHYWGDSFPPPEAPRREEIGRAARLLLDAANPNRLYLVHHHELPFAETAGLFLAWRQSVPPSVEIVPALVLLSYDQAASAVFSNAELEELLTFFRTEMHAATLAVYDVLGGRDQGPALQIVARHFPEALIRLGLQPDEALKPPFTGAVEDTWSALCHGLTSADWRDHGFGRDTLRRWAGLRNRQTHCIAYDLVIVAWDYAATRRGEYPGYDDAHRNMPLPAGRNREAAAEILATARPEALAGFSADLLIVEANSATPEHDGADTFYHHLKTGRAYAGYYAGPWRELCGIFQSLSQGRGPGRGAP